MIDILMLLIAELSVIGCRYHSKKSASLGNRSKRYGYHIQMVAIYTEILELTLIHVEPRKRFWGGD